MRPPSSTAGYHDLTHAEAVILTLQGISKRFGAVQALQGVDFALAQGSVHALLGENGAGKSTLMHIAFGMLAADAGQVLVDGRVVAIHSPRDARKLGIGMVHQHFTSVRTMTVRENVELVGGRRLAAGGWGLGTGIVAQDDPSSHLSLLTSHSLDPSARVESLSVAQQQRLEIVKALATGARILLLDEPTAVLAPPEVDELLPALRRYAEGGGAVVLITHKLREVFAVADRVTVLRGGRVVLDGEVAGRSEVELAEAMVGEGEVGAGRARPMGTAPPPGHSGGMPDGEMRGGRRRHSGGMLVLGGGVEIRAGEILGIAAVEGNGQRELLRAVAGLALRRDLTVQGRVAFVPEDRATEGLIPDLTLAENLVLGMGSEAPWVRGPLVDWSAARQRAGELLAAHDVRAAGPDAPARSLSGGNQQKMVMARAFAQHPDVLVAENPTRGLDIRATTEVHRQLREAADRGAAVLVWASDLDEVLAVADRMVVVRDGQVVPVPAGADRAVVGRLMLGVGGER